MIRVDELRKKFGERDVLRGVSLEVGKGEVAAVIGPSGGGKSTLLRCIVGLEEFDAGRIVVDDAELNGGLDRRARAAALKRIRSRVGMVFQQFHLFAHLSALDNVTEAPMQVLGLSRDEAVARAERLLDRVGLSARSRDMPQRLSGGEQQRVAIARSLAMQPEVILFDEPTSALDPQMTEEVLAVMTDLAASGQAMLVVTHAMSFARRAAGRVHVFCDGRIIESGPPGEVLEAPREAGTREFLRLGERS
jgi:ABC-type polar amino acid transport system ATPase subunit